MGLAMRRKANTEEDKGGTEDAEGGTGVGEVVMVGGVEMSLGCWRWWMRRCSLISGGLGRG